MSTLATDSQLTLATVKKPTRVLVGDCRELLRDLPDECIGAIVTDPPYELGFMGKKWDGTGIAYDVNVWRECLRVLKPGGHLLAFGGTRTYHRMTCAIEDAGFEVRDSLHWIYGSGFPKSMNVQKAGAGAAWQGWGTALKPAHEPIVVARKPLVGTVSANVLKHGTGALNIDGTRVEYANPEDFAKLAAGVASIKARGGSMENSWKNSSDLSNANDASTIGRWPPNVLLSHSPECGDACAEDCTVAEMNRQGDSAKFFPCFHYGTKASKRDRGEGNAHPTVKPIELMRWLVRIVTPPNGVVLDPFTGSGTTGVACAREGFKFLGFEQSEEYANIARARIEHG